jgi:hypothetical protein
MILIKKSGVLHFDAEDRGITSVSKKNLFYTKDKTHASILK